MTDRSKTLEVMEDAISAASDQDDWISASKAASVALTAYESHLQAEGMAVVPGWKPIESAPKDGRSVLVALPGSDEHIEIARRLDGGRWCGSESGWWQEKDYPIRWCPLPAYPASPYRKAVVPTPSPTATELALAEAVGHIALLTAFWMETPGWTRAAEAAREFIGGVPIDWKAPAPQASAERSVANSNPPQEKDPSHG